MVHPSCVTQVLEVYKSQSDLLNQKQIFGYVELFLKSV